ncbi:MAG TPA: hypothetical protein VGC70_05570 [Burkholderiales bacterium]
MPNASRIASRDVVPRTGSASLQETGKLRLPVGRVMLALLC